MAEPGSVLLKRHIRSSKTKPLVDEVELLQANMSMNSKLQHSPQGNLRAFELLKSPLVKFLAPGTRSLVKCPAMWKNLNSNVPAPVTTKIFIFADIFKGCNRHFISNGPLNPFLAVGLCKADFVGDCKYISLCSLFLRCPAELESD